MGIPLLVATPHASFGELIRQSLEETGSYKVRIVDSRPGALSALKQEEFQRAFLDFDLGPNVVVSIGQALRKAKPDILLTVIMDQEDLSESLDEIEPWTVLHKPFYLPDLLRMLGENADESQDEQQVATAMPEVDEISWLDDVDKAAQHLTRLTLESSAQAALITRQNTLWAYAGGLSQEAANEIVLAIARYWDTQKESDLLRFIRLEATRAEHMLYATRLSTGVIMAMVFDAETPFSTIRSQANRLAQSLSISDSNQQPERLPAPKTVDGPASPLDDFIIGEDEDDLEIPSISSILYDVPPPRPAMSMPVDSLPPPPQTEPEVEEPEIEYPSSVIETRPSAAAHFSQESSPAIPLHQLFRSDQKPKVETLAETRPSQVPAELETTAPSKARRPVSPLQPPTSQELGETRPSSTNDLAQNRALEPISPGLYNLTYACLLVPRLSSHYLTGDLAEQLSTWMPEICVSFGWRLEFLTVRPEYLQWVVNVPPSSSPGYLMRIIRQQTSERIFANFPRIKRENPSGDFWAPGYLIMGGDRPHPPQLVKDYINQTRQRQGISRPRPRR